MLEKTRQVICLGAAMVFFLLSLEAQPSAFDARDISYGKLRRLIESQNLSTVEEVLSRFPESLRSDYVLMYSSGSVQPASFQKPRVLLFSTDARFVMAFNDTADFRGYRKLEIMQFSSETDEFEFYEIRFNPAAVPPEQAVFFSEKNPFVCGKCHRDDLRPNWDPFPVTVGAYGSFDDRISRGSAEDLGMRSLIQARDKGPYRFLVGLGQVRDHTPMDYQLAGTPNRRFGAALNELNFRRLRRNLRNAPGFDPFRYALQATLTPGCSEEIEAFVPGEVRGTFKASFAEIRSDTVKRRRNNTRFLQESAAQFAGLDQGKVSRLLPLPIDDGKEATALRYIVEVGMKTPLWDWTMTREADSFLFASSDFGLEHLGDLLLPKIVEDHPELGSLKGKAFCSRLRELSLNNDWRAHGRSDHPAPVLPMMVDAFMACTGCHTGPMSIGPGLPFDDPNVLALALKRPLPFSRHSNGAPWRLFDEMLYRINDIGGSDQMPKGHPLDAQQRQSMETHLRSLLIEPSP